MSMVRNYSTNTPLVGASFKCALLISFHGVPTPVADHLCPPAGYPSIRPIPSTTSYLPPSIHHPRPCPPPIYHHPYIIGLHHPPPPSHTYIPAITSPPTHPSPPSIHHLHVPSPPEPAAIVRVPPHPVSSRS
jgi:hypothetical protein